MLALAWAVYAGGIGVYAARCKGRPAIEGCLLGILAGPFGWLLVAALPSDPGAPGRPARAGEASDEEKVDVDVWDMHEIMGMPKVRP